MFHRMKAWSDKNMPKRETFEKMRWLQPVAHRVLLPELWRFHRRSVPRGVALGMLVGILVPIAQFLIAALFALPVRANVPVAALTTIVTNPFTTPAIWLAAYTLGCWLMGIDMSAKMPQPTDHEGWIAQASAWLHWIVSDAARPFVLGMIVIAVVAAAIGYVAASFLWREWIARKWRHRHAHRRAAAE